MQFMGASFAFGNVIGEDGEECSSHSAAEQRMQKRSRMIPPGSRSASHNEEVDYQKKGECREGCLKVALKHLPRTESHQEEYESEEQDNWQFFHCVASYFFHYCSNS
jgi:hypothetical protein